MNAEQFISIADTLRARALDAGADLNASNYLVHATLIRALREHTLDEIAPEALAMELDRSLRPA
jgi:hypothetical protein